MSGVDGRLPGLPGRPILASLCGGPIFLTAAVIVLAATGSGPSPKLGGMFVLLPFALAFGLVISLIPNLLGTVALHALGKRYEVARLPASWAVVGALLAGGAVLALSATPEVAGLFAVTGAGSAMICRWNVEWP